MHRKGIVHRDIKPDNILLIDSKDLSVCITDLGMACLFNDEEELKMKCGSPGYVAPEILKCKAATTKVDIFSLGSLFFNLISGTSLYKGSSAKEVLKNNKYTNPIPTIENKLSGHVSRECVDILKLMVTPEPDQRPSAEQCLHHAWFAKDREALDNSLMINKNHHMLTNILRNTPS